METIQTPAPFSLRRMSEPSSTKVTILSESGATTASRLTGESSKKNVLVPLRRIEYTQVFKQDQSLIFPLQAWISR